MSILETANELLEAIEEHNRTEAYWQEYKRKLDAWWEECRLRAVAQNPQTFADKGEPL